MDDTRDIEAQVRLFKHYRAVEKSYIDGLELAALSGDVDPNNPELLSNGMRSRYGLTPEKIAAAKRKRGQSSDGIFELILFLQAIDEALEQINQIIAELEERMAEILDQMARDAESADQLDHEHDVLEGELEFFQKNGRFNIEDADAFSDAEAEAIIARYEQETDQVIDRTDPASYCILRHL